MSDIGNSKRNGLQKQGHLQVMVLFACALLFSCSSDTMKYKDPQEPIDKRVEDLLRRMTLEEKIGQMNMPVPYGPMMGKTLPSKLEACRRFTPALLAVVFGYACHNTTLTRDFLRRLPVWSGTDFLGHSMTTLRPLSSKESAQC